MGELLPLQIGGGAVPVGVAGVVERFPGSDGRDGRRRSRSRCAPRSTPRRPARPARTRSGSTSRRSAWTGSPTRWPGRRSERSRRRSRRRRGRGTPRSARPRDAPRAAGASPLVALLLAALGLALAVRADLRDDQRRALRSRGAGRVAGVPPPRRPHPGGDAVALAGLVAGLADRPRCCCCSSHASSPSRPAAVDADPPLAAVVDPRSSRWASSLFAALAALLVGVATRRAFAGARGPPYRETDLMPLVDARELFAVYPSPAGGVAALQGLTLSVAEERSASSSARAARGRRRSCACSPGLRARPRVARRRGARCCRTHLPASSSRYRRDVLGYADQHYWRALAGELTAEELVAVPLGLAAADARERRARARELLERVGLLDRADARPRELSGGEQQRIALCAAARASPEARDRGRADRRPRRGVCRGRVLALLAELVAEHGDRRRSSSATIRPRPRSQIASSTSATGA